MNRPTTLLFAGLALLTTVCSLALAEEAKSQTHEERLYPVICIGDNITFNNRGQNIRMPWREASEECSLACGDMFGDQWYTTIHVPISHPRQPLPPMLYVVGAIHNVPKPTTPPRRRPNTLVPSYDPQVFRISSIIYTMPCLRVEFHEVFAADFPEDDAKVTVQREPDPAELRVHAPCMRFVHPLPAEVEAGIRGSKDFQAAFPVVCVNTAKGNDEVSARIVVANDKDGEMERILDFSCAKGGREAFLKAYADFLARDIPTDLFYICGATTFQSTVFRVVSWGILSGK